MNIQEKIQNLMSKKTPEGVIKNDLSDRFTSQDKAYAFFHSVKGLPEIKENLYLNLVSTNQVNTLLVGPPATAKSLFMSCIKEGCRDVIYFDAASGGTGAGLIQVLKMNRSAKILIIDEIDKMKKNDLAVILSLLNDGTVSKTLKSEVINFKMNVRIFATSNSSAKLSKPIKSRFEIYVLPEYSEDEFVEVVQHCLKNRIAERTAEVLARVLIAHDMKNVRLAINLANKIQQNHTEEDVCRIIENLLKFTTKEDLDYN